MKKNDDRDLEEAHNVQLDVSPVRAELTALSCETSSWTREKKILNLQATMYYFKSLLSKHIRSLPVSKVDFINRWKT